MFICARLSSFCLTLQTLGKTSGKSWVKSVYWCSHHVYSLLDKLSWFPYTNKCMNWKYSRLFWIFWFWWEYCVLIIVLFQCFYWDFNIIFRRKIEPQWDVWVFVYWKNVVYCCNKFQLLFVVVCFVHNLDTNYFYLLLKQAWFFDQKKGRLEKTGRLPVVL